MAWYVFLRLVGPESITILTLAHRNGQTSRRCVLQRNQWRPDLLNHHQCQSNHNARAREHANDIA